MTTATSELSDDEIRAVEDPLARARILRQISRPPRDGGRGTLTVEQSAIWTATIAEIADADERNRQWWIARMVGVSRSRISQILARARSAAHATSTPEGVTPSASRL